MANVLKRKQMMSAERERKLQESVQKEQVQMQSVRMKFNMTQGWHDSFIKSPKSKLGKKQGRQQSETHSTIAVSYTHLTLPTIYSV